MADLLIRAAMNDHVALGDVVPPSIRPLPSGRRPLVGRLVADAHVAAARPVLAETARGAGIPYLIDPDTTLMQSLVAEKDKWTKLPYGASEPVAHDNVDCDELAELVVEFQLERGATAVIPAYFYASCPSDPWFALSLDMIEATADYMRDHHIHLPMMPLFCGQLQSFVLPANWKAGVDKFTSVALDVGATTTAFCLSPSGASSDGYGKISRLFATAGRIKSSGVEVIAWRQGVYGLALVAAGLDGYECGMGTGEQTQVARRQSSRRPRPDDKKSGGGGGAGIYLETLGRSVPRAAGQILLANLGMRAKVMCDDESCCPSVAETLDQSQQHAVRARARQLNELLAQPHASWRLNSVAKQATSAATISKQATSVLRKAGYNLEINSRSMTALAKVAAELSDALSGPKSA